MLNPDFAFLIVGLLGLVLAIPSNACIVTAYLEIIRKKERLSPSDVIFMAKTLVNILLQGLMTVEVIFLVFADSFTQEGFFVVMMTSTYFLTYFSFWLTVWLSVYYWTTITNLNYGFFIWLKGTVSNFLCQVLLLTALGIFPLSVLNIWAFKEERHYHPAMNSTEVSIVFLVSLPYFVPMTFLGCILPFCLSLLCLLLTFSFLVRHVWRVKNNDSGSSRPNLQVHVTALRTIFFLLLMFTSFSISEVVVFIVKSPEFVFPVYLASWTVRLLSPSIEAAIIFQASSKLKGIILGRFWTRSRRNTET